MTQRALLIEDHPATLDGDDHATTWHWVDLGEQPSPGGWSFAVNAPVGRQGPSAKPSQSRILEHVEP